MRVDLPEFNTKKEAFEYLKTHKDDLIARKKSLPIKSDDCDFGCDSLAFSETTHKTKSIQLSTKAALDAGLKDDEIRVKAIANVIGFCDSHDDVLIKDCAKKTISHKGASNQSLFYHLKNHGYTSDDIIGRKSEATLEDIDLKRFNVVSDIKTTQAIMGHSIVSKRYDEKCFYLYSDDEIKQHSIGLMYHKIFLCLDSSEPEDATFKEAFDKYYPEVINKGKVDEKGYFFAVTEIRLLEFSAVLFGANELTPTEEVSKTSTDTEQSNQADQPEESTDNRKKLLSL